MKRNSFLDFLNVNLVLGRDMKKSFLLMGCAVFFTGCTVTPPTVEVPLVTNTHGIRTMQPVKKGHRGEQRKERREKSRKDD